MDGLCLIVDCADWSRSRIPERIRLQTIMMEITETACRRSGFAMNALHHAYTASDVHLVLPDRRNPAAGVPGLIREFHAALARANRQNGSPVRLRLLFTAGPVVPPGIALHSIVDGLRLAGSPALRTAVERMPATELTVIASDSFYRNVVCAGAMAHRPGDYQPVRLGRDLPGIAWLYRPDPAPVARTSPEPPPATASPAPADPLIRSSAHASAVRDLEETLRALPGPDAPAAAEALLRLGDRHQEAGALEAAAQTWLFLLAWHPTCADAYHRLGRLELRRGRADRAAVYLREGLHLTRAFPERRPAAAADRSVCEILLDLAWAEESRGNGTTADKLINEAAEADPLNPLPLISMAYRAARRSDLEAARRLVSTAVARVSDNNKKEFLHREYTIASMRNGGDTIMSLLREHLAPRQRPDSR